MSLFPRGRRPKHVRMGGCAREVPHEARRGEMGLPARMVRSASVCRPGHRCPPRARAWGKPDAWLADPHSTKGCGLRAGSLHRTGDRSSRSLPCAGRPPLRVPSCAILAGEVDLSKSGRGRCLLSPRPPWRLTVGIGEYRTGVVHRRLRRPVWVRAVGNVPQGPRRADRPLRALAVASHRDSRG